eukprot:3314831-Ditylum_brightwellii.AAC.1
MSNKPTLAYKRLDKPMEIHKHRRLKDCDVRPGCEFCKHDWGLRVFHAEDTGRWKDEVKRSNFRCTYCE